MSEETITVREAIEQVLAQRILAEPGFLERLVIDPDGTAKPVLSELVADDGSMDLDDVNITVHFETEKNLHIVVPLLSESTAEVAGFGYRPRLQNLRITPPIFGAAEKHTDAYMCTESGVCPCTGDECTTGSGMAVKSF